MGVKSKRKRRRNTAVSSRRQGNDDNKFRDGWEKIYGNKDENSTSSDGADSDGGDEDLDDKADPKDPAPWCTRPQIP